MIDEINAALENYEQQWQKLISVRHERQFFAKLKPTAAGWKVKDRAEFNERLSYLQDLCDQAHLAWLNGRWLATLHLKDQPLANGSSVIKLMQRRPDSTDSTGLDHVDFLIDAQADAKGILSAEDGLRWSEEMNGEHCKWLSVWFDGTEAKLRRDTVLQVCADELIAVQQKLVDGSV